MKKRITRRRFITASGIGAVSAPSLLALAQAPQVLTRRSAKPVVVAAANGNKSKDAEGLTCVARAFKRITEGADVLDAVISGVNIVELDPEDTSVGYGGLPNADGVVQLDASVMHGPLKRAGAVACLEGVRTPSLVAKRVMEQTDHHLLVGLDAQRFARSMGFRIEDDLNTEKSRQLWLEWKRRIDPAHYLDPKDRADAERRAGQEMIAEGLVDPEHFYGTINCSGVNAKGEVCGVTTTSGLAWKIPGRVGDSPILGAGLYVDGDVGAAGSTGRGEANLFSLSSFLIVEAMRNGVLAGYPVEDVKVRLFDGSFHDVDSSEMAFKVAGSMGIKDALKKASPVLLEPMMAVEVVTPEEFMGDVMGDLSSRRGHIEGMEPRGNAQIIRAKVPLSEMFGYATDLRSRTQGRASYTMQFKAYEQVPKSIAEEIVSKAQGDYVRQ